MPSTIKIILNRETKFVEKENQSHLKKEENLNVIKIFALINLDADSSKKQVDIKWQMKVYK